MKSEALLLNACLRIRVEDISHFVCRLRLGFNPPRLSPTSLTIFFPSLISSDFFLLCLCPWKSGRNLIFFSLIRLFLHQFYFWTTLIAFWPRNLWRRNTQRRALDGFTDSKSARSLSALNHRVSTSFLVHEKPSKRVREIQARFASIYIVIHKRGRDKK